MDKEEVVASKLETMNIKVQSLQEAVKRGRSYGRGRSDKSQVQCFNCKKHGHYSAFQKMLVFSRGSTS